MNTFSDRKRETGVLADRLRSLRRRSGLSGKDLAVRLGCHPSRISRLEHGRQLPSAGDLRTWADACLASGNEYAELREMLRRAEAVHRDWKRRMRQGQGPVQADYNQLVAGSRSVRHFEIAWIPGLVQTPEYARQVFREQADLHGLDVHDEDVAVDVRMARKRHLYDPAKRFEFLVAEPVLRWRVCPADILDAQLDELVSVADLPNVRIGVLPLDRALATTPQNAFQIYDDLTVVETFTAETYYDRATSAAYQRILERLWRDAMIGDEFRLLIRSAQRALR